MPNMRLETDLRTRSQGSSASAAQPSRYLQLSKTVRNEEAMKRERKISILTVLFSVLAVVAAWPSAAQPIRIGSSIAISGRDAVQGGYVRDGYLLCQKHVNEKGGVLGRQIQFAIRDDGSDPKAAAGLYEKL